MMTPFPGTVDFLRWEKEQAQHPTMVDETPITRYWLIPTAKRPKMFTPHPSMTSDEIRARTQKVWDRFYEFGAIWKRSSCTPTLRARLAFVLLSEALPANVCRHRHLHGQCTAQEVEELGPLDRPSDPQDLPRQAHA